MLVDLPLHTICELNGDGFTNGHLAVGDQLPSDGFYASSFVPQKGGGGYSSRFDGIASPSRALQIIVAATPELLRLIFPQKQGWEGIG